MTSLLLSTLKSMTRGGTVEDFVRRHPYDWVVWEPGTWRPSGPNTTLISRPDEDGRHAGGEGLAMSLDPKVAKNGQLTLGRREDCHLVINDGTLSSLHLVFVRADEGWVVKDAGSTNGTTLRGARMSPGVPHLLRSGDEIFAGEVRLTYYRSVAVFERLNRLR